jgi:hypothetical protein
MFEPLNYFLLSLVMFLDDLPFPALIVPIGAGAFIWDHHPMYTFALLGGTLSGHAASKYLTLPAVSFAEKCLHISMAVALFFHTPNEHHLTDLLYIGLMWLILGIDKRGWVFLLIARAAVIVTLVYPYMATTTEIVIREQAVALVWMSFVIAGILFAFHKNGQKTE